MNINVRGLKVFVFMIFLLKEITCRRRNDIDLKQKFTEHRLKLLEHGFNVFTKENVPKLELTEHRLELLENGFNKFANEMLPNMEKMQRKLEIVTDTNKELSKKVKDISAENGQIVEELVRQEGVISDLLWAAAELKKDEQLPLDDQNMLKEIEWAVFDLKHSTLALMEDICLRESECSDWSDWGACSVSCGSGTSFRTRECTLAGKFRSYCNPRRSESTTCSDGPCEAVIIIDDLDCPENYVSFRGYCFRMSEKRSSRLIANIMCETDDAHLVEIDSSQKHAIVVDYLQQIGTSYLNETDIFLSANMNTKSEDDSVTNDELETQIAIDGIRYRHETAYLNWKDREMIFYRWAWGQPRNDKSDGDYCITMNPENGQWYLRCCSRKFYYICEAPRGGIY